MKVGDIVHMTRYGIRDKVDTWFQVRMLRDEEIANSYHVADILLDFGASNKERLSEDGTWFISEEEDELTIYAEEDVPDFVWVELAKKRLSE